RGVALQQAVESDTFTSKTLGDLNYLLSSTTYDAAHKRIAVFALNRHLTEAMDFSLELRGLDGFSLVEARTLGGFDFSATNSATTEMVRPMRLVGARVEGSGIAAQLQPASWNAFVLCHA